MVKKILIALLVILVAIQFIRPKRNVSAAPSSNDISMHYEVPADVQLILQKACNDCHSNNTNYPWYTDVQPVGLWLQHHVDEGIAELNFSEFAAYKPKRQAHKMEEVAEMIEENEMPLESYTLIHGNAKLSDAEKATLITWAKRLQAEIETKYNLHEEHK